MSQAVANSPVFWVLLLAALAAGYALPTIIAPRGEHRHRADPEPVPPRLACRAGDGVMLTDPQLLRGSAAAVRSRSASEARVLVLLGIGILLRP
jgi:hypothetical protein